MVILKQRPIHYLLLPRFLVKERELNEAALKMSYWSWVDEVSPCCPLSVCVPCARNSGHWQPTVTYFRDVMSTSQSFKGTEMPPTSTFTFSHWKLLLAGVGLIHPCCHLVSLHQGKYKYNPLLYSLRWAQYLPCWWRFKRYVHLCIFQRSNFFLVGDWCSIFGGRDSTRVSECLMGCPLFEHVS